jgi:hypothetical protein
MATLKLMKGTARRYKAGKGRSISRRARDDIRAQNAGFKSRYYLEKYRKTPEYARKQRIYREIGIAPKSPFTEFDTFMRFQEEEGEFEVDDRGRSGKIIKEFEKTFPHHTHLELKILLVFLGIIDPGDFDS